MASLAGKTDADFYLESPDTEAIEAFIDGVSKICRKYCVEQTQRDTPVIRFRHPEELRDELKDMLSLRAEGRDLAALLTDCETTAHFCVRTGHPRFFNQVSTGLDIISLAGEWLTATTNTNMFTYEIAPVFVLMEDVVLTKMRALIGWSSGDGILSPGGTISNLYGVMAARQRAAPAGRIDGLFGEKPLVLFTSAASHYSVHRAGVIAGVGLKNVVEIPTDEQGCMRVDELRRQVEERVSRQHKPFLVVATAGTTVLGAVDPIPAIADICKEFGIWLHVDAAWGGGLLLSPRWRYILAGIERADSVTWNPHKMMGLTLQCSVFLTTDKTVLSEVNCMCADYLFQQDKHYDLAYDTGDKSLQCGRHNDIFKMWLQFRAKGDDGLAAKIDDLMAKTEYAVSTLAARERFTLLLPQPQCPNVCFWYIPDCLAQLTGVERNRALDKVAPKIKASMMCRGLTMVGYQPLDDKVNFFRLIISNSSSTTGDLDFLFNEIDEIAKDLALSDLQD